ncbi:S8 family peptidase [Cohnella yongneupensis]|uniref:S8 family peptidase n=1 Tax=Cohnella yongneupensis TaxID=425006 RepID=A0ABW0R1C4_9BACL
MTEFQPLSHIEIIREPVISPVRGRQNPNAPRIIPRGNRQAHGTLINQQTSDAITSINRHREQVGISPDSLVVLEFKVLSVNQRETLITAFEISIVEEVFVKEDGVTNYRLLVQFPNSEILNRFVNERQLYEINSPQRGNLTHAQRRDLFDSLETIRKLDPADRMGERLNSEGIPTIPFIADIDLWYDGTPRGAMQTEQLLRGALRNLGGELLLDLFRTPSLLLGKVRLNAEALQTLLNLDIVALVDLPSKPNLEEKFDIFNEAPQNYQNARFDLDEEAPLATIVDSGVFAGHPLLRDGILIEGYDFGTGENTEIDLNGHGTGVAGIVVYGDIPNHLTTGNWLPKVRICNAKVLCNNPVWNTPVFPEEKRPEMMLEEAIRYFHSERGCRIFNLSIGNMNNVYSGGRQFPWAETLDNLSRLLDIVIVVSAGNVAHPEVPLGITRDEIQQQARDNLLTQPHKLIDPGTASICLVVGSVTRRDDFRITGGMARLSVNKPNSPSVFTRSGFGVNGSVKPDLVAPGGSFIIQQAGGTNQWIKNDHNVGEPSLRHTLDDGRWFRGFCGTSFSAPHVTHISAIMEHTLKRQLGRPPSANLIRAMVVNSATVPTEIEDWIKQANDPEDHRTQPRTSEYVLRTMGYGRPSLSHIWSQNNKVTLYAEEVLTLNSFHLYNIIVPPNFLNGRFEKSISISLAYDPPVRLSRKTYTSNRLWFEVYKGLSVAQLEQFRRTRQIGDEDELPTVPKANRTKFLPGYQSLQNSTVQLRTWKKGRTGGADLFKIPVGGNEPTITILVAGKEQFPHPDGQDSQKYALVITFEAQSPEIDLYTQIQQRIRTRTRVRV